MEKKTDSKTIEELIKLNEDGILKPNYEYQRGLVWKEDQMRLLIDSIFRGYPIPLIYLHEKKVDSGGYSRDALEIIDGQQRINTFVGFVNDYAYKDGRKGRETHPFKPLLDPSNQVESKKFPMSMQGSPVDWAGKVYTTLTLEQREKFLKTKVQIVTIRCTDDEARDLFIRLQGGCELTAQQVRDSRPGEFCKLVIEIGGKSQISKQGHEFFQKFTRAKAGDQKARQLVAQVLMLFLLRQAKKKGGRLIEDYFMTADSEALDDFYVQNINMNHVKAEVERFREILNKLVTVLGGPTPSLPMHAHAVIHLVLFTDMLMDQYTNAWESGIKDAHDKFMEMLTEVDKEEYPEDASKDVQDVWYYDRGIRNRSNAHDTMKKRHEIYTNLMMKFMVDSLQRKDPKRNYTDRERESVYYRDGKKCYICNRDVKWDDAEIHHIVEHSKGGQTTLENGVLVHKECHPRGRPKK